MLEKAGVPTAEPVRQCLATGSALGALAKAYWWPPEGHVYNLGSDEIAYAQILC